MINDAKNAACRVEAQHKLLNEFHRMKSELEVARQEIETYINQGKLRATELSEKNTVETNKCIYLP